MGLFLLFIFIAVPVIEIGLFIQVGGFIGLLPTLAIVVITAVLGTYLLRRQGLSIVLKLQAEFAQGQLPVENLIHGAFIVVAGLLLLTPGFFTDFIGFSLFIPQVRLMAGRFIGKQIKNKAAAQPASASSFQFHSSYHANSEKNRANSAHENGEIEGEYEVVDEEIVTLSPKDDTSEPPHKDSPWNK